MKNWKGTTGEWILKGFTVWKGGERIRQISGPEGACMTSMRLNHERKIADAELIADAGNTIQKCDLLPSELLERYNEAVEALKDNQYILDFAANVVRDNGAKQEKNSDNWVIGESLQERFILNNELIKKHESC